MDFKYLSMGMSNDRVVAVEEGSTVIRVGTAIFGARSYTSRKCLGKPETGRYF